MKYLLIALVIWAVVWIMLRPRKPPKSSAASATPTRSAREGAGQTMVQCQHCGVHLPRGDAVQGQDGMFCSEAHRLAGPR